MSCKPIVLRCNSKLVFAIKFRQYSKSIPHLNVKISIIKILCIWFQHWHLGWPVWQLDGGNGNTNILTYVFPTYLCSDETSSTQPPWAHAEGSSSHHPLPSPYSRFFRPYVQPDSYSQGREEDKEMSLGGQTWYSWFILIHKYLKSAFFPLYIS